MSAGGVWYYVQEATKALEDQPQGPCKEARVSTLRCIKPKYLVRHCSCQALAKVLDAVHICATLQGGAVCLAAGLVEAGN